MSAEQQATPREGRVIGAVCAAVGLYFMAVGLSVLPPPGESSPKDPLWIAFVAGLVFLLGGAGILVQAYGKASAQGELPADAPRWMRAVQYLILVAIFASFALLGSYVAIGGDPQKFSGGIPFVGHGTNISIARVAFGIGAIICWLATIAAAVQGVRKVMSRGTP